MQDVNTCKNSVIVGVGIEDKVHPLESIKFYLDY